MQTGSKRKCLAYTLEANMKSCIVAQVIVKLLAPGSTKTGTAHPRGCMGGPIEFVTKTLD